MNYKIIKATKDNIDQVGKLFDLYRQFYKYKSNVHESTNYISERISNNESIIFLALTENNYSAGLFNFMKLLDLYILEK